MMSAAPFGNRGNSQQHSGNVRKYHVSPQTAGLQIWKWCNTLAAALNHDIRHINIIYTLHIVINTLLASAGNEIHCECICMHYMLLIQGYI